jgi:hypothetical protein
LKKRKIFLPKLGPPLKISLRGGSVKIFLIVVFFVFFECLLPRQGWMAFAELDPKVKAVTTLALYGTVGGALLGAATMAYGTSSRAIFKGASLGLYAGLLFGGYVALSHHYQQKDNRPSESYPEDAGGPYQEGDSGGGMDYSDSGDRRWHPSEEGREWFESHRTLFFDKGKRESGRYPAFSIPLFQHQF